VTRKALIECVLLYNLENGACGIREYDTGSFVFLLELIPWNSRYNQLVSLY